MARRNHSYGIHGVSYGVSHAHGVGNGIAYPHGIHSHDIAHRVMTDSLSCRLVWADSTHLVHATHLVDRADTTHLANRTDLTANMAYLIRNSFEQYIIGQTVMGMSISLKKLAMQIWWGLGVWNWIEIAEMLAVRVWAGGECLHRVLVQVTIALPAGQLLPSRHFSVSGHHEHCP